MDGFLQTAGSDIAGRPVVGVVEKQDGEYVLFDGKGDADFGAEGTEDDMAIGPESEQHVEDGVDEGVELDGVGIHVPVIGFEKHWVFWFRFDD